MDEIAVQDFVGEPDFGAPALEHLLLAGVVFGVGIEVKVGAYRWTQVLEIEAPPAIDHAGVLRQRLELIALRRGIAHDASQDQLQVLPVQELGLLDVMGPQPQGGHPLGQDRLRAGRNGGDRGQGAGEDQHARMVAPVVGARGILGEKGREVCNVPGR